jgi:hypothetical protein
MSALFIIMEQTKYAKQYCCFDLDRASVTVDDFGDK